MAETRHASATWSGNLTEGAGMLQYVSSGAFSRMPLTWGSRTEAHEGRTSPEELLAAIAELFTRENAAAAVSICARRRS